MRLAALLSDLSAEDLDSLALEHLPADHRASRHEMCSSLESILRSFGFVQRFVLARQPPAFGMLVSLLEAEDHQIQSAALREISMAETDRICADVSSGELIERDNQLRVYRRVLGEARRVDVDIDPSEAGILAVLRKELSIRHVEHYLVEHHPELQQYWNSGHAFLHEHHALRSVGLIFARDGSLVLADELVPLVRRALGLEMDRGDARRLFAELQNVDLGEALKACGLRTSGSKDDRIERLIANWIQPSEVLAVVGITDLREVARVASAKISGSKEELIARLVHVFAHGADQAKEELAPAPPPAEPRTLDDVQFRAMFGVLTGADLTEILRSIDSSRLTGSKSAKIELVQTSRFSEQSLLMNLTNRSLESVLERLRLKISGSKGERVGRVVAHFKEMSPEVLKALGFLDVSDEQSGPSDSASALSLPATSLPSSDAVVSPTSEP